MKKKIPYILILSLLLGNFVGNAGAAGVSSTQQKKNQVDSKINSITKQKQQVLKDKAALEKNKNELESKQSQENKSYQKVLGEMQLLKKDLVELDKSIEQSENIYDKQKSVMEARLRAMYENSSMSYIQVLLESKSITDFFERFELISLITKKDKEMLEAMDSAKKDLEYKRELSENAKFEKQKLVSLKLNNLNELTVSRSGLEERIKKSKEQLERLEQQEDDLVKQSQQLADQIRKAAQKGTKYAGGSMVWPSTTSKQIISPFGMRKHPILKKNKMHTGIDINSANGTSTVAANKGKVILSGWQSGYGNTIIIDHGGGITTLYAHSSKLLVKTGDTVDAGQVIAKVGSTGLSTGPHLHFEVRKNGELVSPLDYVSP